MVAAALLLIRLSLQPLAEVRRSGRRHIHGDHRNRCTPGYGGYSNLPRSDSTRPPSPRSWTGSAIPRPTTRSVPPGTRSTAPPPVPATDRDTAHRRLVASYEWVAQVDIDERTSLATTIERCQDQVLAYLAPRPRTQQPIPPRSRLGPSAEPAPASATPSTTRLASAFTPANPVGSPLPTIRSYTLTTPARRISEGKTRNLGSMKGHQTPLPGGKRLA